MAESASSDERVREGDAALARGAWAEARAIFEQELEAHETVDALEGLSWAAWWVEDVPTCLEARERAYRLSRREGDTRRAAMLALWIADDHLILRGERAIANGWFQRAARLLEGLEPCPEHGWLDALLGYVATRRRRSVEGEGPRGPGARARPPARRGLARDVRARGRGPGAGERRRGRGRHALPRRSHRRRAGGRVRGDRAGGVDLLLPAQCVRAGARLRARCGVVRQGRGVQPQDEDELRHARLPGPLRRRPDLAGPLARGRAVADRGDGARRRAALLERAGDRAARRSAPPPGPLRRGRGAPPQSRGQRARPGGDGRARPRPGRCLDGRRSARAGASPHAGAEQDAAGGPAGGDGEGEGRDRRGRGGRCAPRGAALDRGGGGDASATRLGEPLRRARRGGRRRPRDGAREARGRRRAVRRERRVLRARAGAA